MADIPDYMKQNQKFISTTVSVEKTQTNVGSTAGAGSGDFHQYRQLRRKERYRLVQMEAESRKAQALQEHEAQRQDRFLETENRTLKKSLKRREKKERKKLIKKMGGPPPKPVLTCEVVIQEEAG
jgi:hypothetical protein